MYYRFQGPGVGGLFQLSPSCLHARSVPNARAVRAQRLRSWLWCNTPAAPGRAYSTPTPGTRASCWFRAEASQHIRAAWELSELYAAAGVPVRLLRSRNPGRVVFRDRVQVVVWSGRDLPRGMAVPPYHKDRHEARRDRTTIRRWDRPYSSEIPDETWTLIASQRLSRRQRREDPAPARAEGRSAYPPP